MFIKHFVNKYVWRILPFLFVAEMVGNTCNEKLSVQAERKQKLLWRNKLYFVQNNFSITIEFWGLKTEVFDCHNG